MMAAASLTARLFSSLHSLIPSLLLLSSLLSAETPEFVSNSEAAPPVTAETLAENIRTRHFSGEPYEFDFKETDLRDILSFLSKISGVNMAVDSGIQGSVTIELRNTPWDAALAVFLRMNRLRVEAVGNILWIERIRKPPSFPLSQLLPAMLLFLTGILSFWVGRRTISGRKNSRAIKKKKPLNEDYAASCLK